MLKDWSWKAILGGLAVDIVGSLIIGTVVTVLLSFKAISNGDLSSATRAFAESIPYLSFALVTGLVMDCVGGYAAAAWAPRRKMLNASMVGILSLSSGFLLNVGSYPLWYQLISLTCIVPAAVLGGWWRVKTRGAESEIKPKDDSTSRSPPIASPN
jgi:hypothetical protein